MVGVVMNKFKELITSFTNPPVDDDLTCPEEFRKDQMKSTFWLDFITGGLVFTALLLAADHFFNWGIC